MLVLSSIYCIVFYLPIACHLALLRFVDQSISINRYGSVVVDPPTPESINQSIHRSIHRSINMLMSSTIVLLLFVLVALSSAFAPILAPQSIQQQPIISNTRLYESILEAEDRYYEQASQQSTGVLEKPEVRKYRPHPIIHPSIYLYIYR